jgi:hypothetical protein
MHIPGGSFIFNIFMGAPVPPCDFSPLSATISPSRGRTICPVSSVSVWAIRRILRTILLGCPALRKKIASYFKL